jgi:hypothetical protein
MFYSYNAPADPPICKLVISPEDGDRIKNELTGMKIDQDPLFPQCPELDDISSSIRVQLREDVDELFRTLGWRLALPLPD